MTFKEVADPDRLPAFGFANPEVNYSPRDCAVAGAQESHGVNRTTGFRCPVPSTKPPPDNPILSIPEMTRGGLRFGAASTEHPAPGAYE